MWILFHEDGIRNSSTSYGRKLPEETLEVDGTMMFQRKSKKIQGGARCRIYITQETHWGKLMNIFKKLKLLQKSEGIP
jgi:hypothetical protein